MEFRNDDLQPVTVIATSLSDSLQISRTKTDRIEDLLKKLSKYSDLDTEKLFKEEPISSTTNQLSQADRLRTENLELMLEIERQDYLSKKWEQVLQQNENILDTIKEWINENPLVMSRKTIDLESRLQDLTMSYNNSKNGILRDVEESQKKIALAERILASIMNELSFSEKNKKYYQDKRVELSRLIEQLEDMKK